MNTLPARVLKPSPAGRPMVVDAAARRASVSESEPVSVAGGSVPVPTKAVASYRGPAAPGLKIELDASRSIGEDLRFSWLQTRGPKIKLKRADEPRLTLIVPGNATELAFVLFASGRGGTDQAELEIPLALHPGAEDSGSLIADAGDDQTGVVDRRVTLNGLRSRILPRGGRAGSTPATKLAYRWIQVGGPSVPLIEQNWVCMFSPRDPGLYRFLLVVAADGEISHPDAVDVWITHDVPHELAAGDPAVDPGFKTWDVHAELSSVPGGLARAGEVALSFEGVARRMDLYEAYQDVQAELARRLDALMPAGEAARSAWEKSVMIPLSESIIRTMAPTGLDLSNSEADATPLTQVQKRRLATLFVEIARGFRAAAGLPLNSKSDASLEGDVGSSAPKIGD